MVDIDRAAAAPAGPALVLAPDKCPDAVLLYCRKVLQHAHVIFHPVPPVQLFQPPARERSAGMLVPFLHLPAGSDGAVPPALTVSGITTPAPVPLPQKSATDNTVHATGCDEGCPEPGFCRHTRD